jgi:hypothetical protein
MRSRYGVRCSSEPKRPSVRRFLDIYQGVLLNFGLWDNGVWVEWEDGLTVEVSEAQDGGVVGIADSTFVWESGQSGPGNQNQGESLHLRSCADLVPCQGT